MTTGFPTISLAAAAEHRSDAAAHPKGSVARKMSIFDEQYRVIAIDGDRLLIRGVLTGNELAIVNPEPETPLTPAEFPPGKLITLTDPSTNLMS